MAARSFSNPALSLPFSCTATFEEVFSCFACCFPVQTKSDAKGEVNRDLVSNRGFGLCVPCLTVFFFREFHASHDQPLVACCSLQCCGWTKSVSREGLVVGPIIQIVQQIDFVHPHSWYPSLPKSGLTFQTGRKPMGQSWMVLLVFEKNDG